MKSIKVLIVGAGRIAGLNELDKFRIKPCTHYGAFKRNKKFIVKAVVDKNINRARKFGNLFNLKFYSSLNTALREIRPELISIAVPYSLNFSIISKCANSKYKPKIIFCEKPISNNILDAKKIIKICNNNNINLFINNRKLEEPYKILKNLVIKKFKNKVISVNSQCSSGIHTIGSHLIDIVRHICGEASFVFGIQDNSYVKKLPYSKNFTNKDPRISSIIKFKNGIIGSFNCSAKLDYTYFEIEVLCKDGKIKISDNGNLIDYWIRKKPGKSTLSYGLKKFSVKFKKKSLFNQIPKYIFNNRNSKNNLISGKEGYNSYRLLDRMIKSSKKNIKINV